MKIAKEVKNIIEGDVEFSEKTLNEYSTDASIFKVKPKLVVFPKSSQDLKSLVNFVSQKNNEGESISLTMRSGGTDMTGGPLNDSIIVDINRYLNKAGEVSKGINKKDHSANKYTVGYGSTRPGAYYRNFELKTLKENLLMPSYPASREICTVGGMVANNSGGEKTLRYGKTEQYVAELDVILADGEKYKIKPLNSIELKNKKEQDNFEGELYRKVYNLIESNYDIIQEAKPKVSKNSAGYNLWNIWDKESGIFDMTQLFVGSQGTLGIIDNIKFRLVEPAKHKKMVVLFLRNTEELANIVNKSLKFNPESLESYDDKTLKLVFKYFIDFIKILGFKNIFKLAWSFLPEAKLVLSGGFPKLIILAEFTGDDKTEVEKIALEAQKSLDNFDTVSTHLVKDELEAKKYWTIRREAFNLIRNHLKGEKSEPFIDDLIVRPEKLPIFLPKLYKILDQYKDKMTYAIGGHSGDGNMHIYSIMDPHDPETRDIIEELSEKVYALTLELEGSITAEHNDGLIRSPFLKQMYGEEIYKLFKEIKNIFDPKDIFNPKKKVNSDFQYALDHFKED